ncbi:MAG: hypothetical protein KatS3mg053_2915 [Candidatus Roseilinea sp.]|nr:MAG: hypothetical protein KatS3mg053_2915 [Candidatus Roseilinea sp.]
MKLALIAYGTRGDVQPFVSLAWALRERHHEVRLVIPHNMAGWVAKTGLPFAEIPVEEQLPHAPLPR